MSEHQSRQSHNIWLLRIWQESGNGAWRATVSESSEDTQHSFTTKEALIAYLAGAMAQTMGDAAQSDAIKGAKLVKSR